MTRLQHLRAVFAVAERHPHAFGPHLTGPVVIDLLTLAEASVALATTSCVTTEDDVNDGDPFCDGPELRDHLATCQMKIARLAWLAAVERVK